MGDALKLYNTLTREKAEFRPIDADNVRMYVCGPTVYDFAHIGNARPVIVFDVLFRLLRHLYGEDHVTYVRNITDVDDKINTRAKRDYPDLPLNEAIRKVTEKTADQFHKDIAALGVLEPTVEPRATDHIDGMVAMIQTLLDKGNAYVAQGAEGREVLFDVPSMPDYGRLSRRNLEDQQAGARIAVESHKKSPADFVLWKESAADEPGWDGRFTFEGKTETINGRPGWHIECSVMSEKHLGETFDIHGGGLDLIFPHHENEIAQSCSAHGNHVMANVWMHNGFVQVEGRKMSKSEGNFFTIRELLETENFGGRKWPGEVLRLAMLMTHYREPIDFSVKRLEEAESRLRKWRSISVILPKQSYPAPPKEFISALKNDLDSVSALAVIDSIYDRAKTEGERLGVGACLNFLRLQQTSEDLEYIFELSAKAGEYRFRYYSRDRCESLDEIETFNKIWAYLDVNLKLEERLAFIREKNWAEADRIRDELAAQGIQLKDSKNKETGERETTWEVKR
ncbi:cysteine--tRNA ligase [Martelella sp. AD-3]|uniref:cysteine--tRNA ligase n=1 Tax=Martelella sp. AD-3 TaxID=686597 RepID=UPI00046617E4|nr:cysteine--tRNA ligase [Martelella sp. AD-3]AMM84349.1 cysteine--tRNA ligase [Martelella sp. AD-3]